MGTSDTRNDEIEVVRLLADGMAHDLHNLLATILMTVSFNDQQEAAPIPPNLLKLAERAVHRSMALTGEIRRLPDTLADNEMRLQPRHLLIGCEKRARGLLDKAGIRLKSSYAPDLPLLVGRPLPLFRALRALYLSPLEALPEGGEAKSHAALVELDRDAAAVHDAIPGTYLKAAITYPPNTAPARPDPAPLTALVATEGGFAAVADDPDEGLAQELFLRAVHAPPEVG